MIRIGFAVMLAYIAAVSPARAQHSTLSERLDKENDWLINRWRGQIAQDLKRKQVVRAADDPIVPSLETVFEGIKPLLPAGKLSVDVPKNAAAGSTIRLQVQTTLEETEKTRFVRLLQVIVEKWTDAPTVQDRLAEFLRTPAIYESGPVQGNEPGELCYHVNNTFGASEIYIRNNVIVALHCSGPTSIRKITRGSKVSVEELARERGEDTNENALCPSTVEGLGLQIDQLIRGALKHP